MTYKRSVGGTKCAIHNFSFYELINKQLTSLFCIHSDFTLQWCHTRNQTSEPRPPTSASDWIDYWCSTAVLHFLFSFLMYKVFQN